MCIVWLAVICDIDCVWIGCCCVLLFSWVFFCFFFLGPGVTLFFPYKELLINWHRTRRSNKDFKYLEEAQLNIMVYPVNCIIALISAQNTNGVLDWLSASSLHQYKILTTVMIQPAEKQVRYKVNGIFSDRGMDHIQSFGSIMHDAWNMLSSEIKSECDMLKEDNQTIFLMQITSPRILWVCVWISVCISVWSFGYKKLSLLPHAIGRN